VAGTRRLKVHLVHPPPLQPQHSPVEDGEGQEGRVPEHLQDEGFCVGQPAAVRQPQSPLLSNGLVCGKSRGGERVGVSSHQRGLGPRGSRVIDSPSSSWILFWVSGYATRYMRLQDRPVVTVPKPGQRGEHVGEICTTCRARSLTCCLTITRSSLGQLRRQRRSWAQSKTWVSNPSEKTLLERSALLHPH